MRAGFQTPKHALARLYCVARGALAVFGVATLLAVALSLTQEVPVEQVVAATMSGDGAANTSLSCAGATVEAPPENAPAIEPAAQAESTQEREQRALADFIAKRYSVAESASIAFVSTAYRSGHELGIDPVLILAVMAVESRYNPVAESSMGAKGLMQVIPRYHQEKLLEHGGEYALLDPEVNIRVGAQILHEYIGRAGVTETALQMYNGALDEPTARYAGKVMAERARLQQFLVEALGEI